MAEQCDCHLYVNRVCDICQPEADCEAWFGGEITWESTAAWASAIDGKPEEGK